MRRALELAKRGWGRVAPNPLVGAVVLRDGRAIGEGFHAGPGRPHAETVALDAAGAEAHGATLCVTLEPCSHHGRTPPCTEAIIAAGISRVIYAVRDPHPEAGGGAGVLREAGIHVEGGVQRDEAVRLNAAFLWRTTTGRPLVTLKLARSLDGMIAAAPGRRTRITGPAAEAYVHVLRAGADAVLVGATTARVDDPRLTVRGEAAPPAPPLRVVLDSSASLDPEGRLARSADRAPVLVVASQEPAADRRAALADRGVEVAVVGAGVEGRPDPAVVLELLAARGVGSVLVEGGAEIAAAFLDAGCVERFVEFVAPSWLGPEGVRIRADVRPLPPEWRLVDTTMWEGDACLTWERAAAFDMLRAAA